MPSIRRSRKRALSPQPTYPATSKERFPPTNDSVPQASFHGIPQEIRDIIYELVHPPKNIHIRYGTGDPSPRHWPGMLRKGILKKAIAAQRKQQKPKFSHQTCAQGQDYDVTKAIEWGETIQRTRSNLPDNYPYYSERHSSCFRAPRYRLTTREPRMSTPYSLLLVSRQIFTEFRHHVYKTNSFTFIDAPALSTFALKLPSTNIASIRDLRLVLKMAGYDRGANIGFYHCRYNRTLAVAHAFSGLKNLHAEIELRFQDYWHMRDVMDSEEGREEWTRCLMAFRVCGGLERVRVVLQVSFKRRDGEPVFSEGGLRYSAAEWVVLDLVEWAKEVERRILEGKAERRGP